MSHPVYGVGTSALVYIGDQVSDRADGVPIGTVEIIGRTHVSVLVRKVKGGHIEEGHDPADLCLVKRAEP